MQLTVTSVTHSQVLGCGTLESSDSCTVTHSRGDPCVRGAPLSLISRALLLQLSAETENFVNKAHGQHLLEQVERDRRAGAQVP